MSNAQYSIVRILLKIFILLPLGVGIMSMSNSIGNAQPSFRCTGNLSRVERAICGSRNLSRLDRSMVRIYRRKFSTAGNRSKRVLRAEQSVWVTWRDTCGGNVRCLDRRYFNRINGLLGRPAAGGNPGPSEPAPAAAADTITSRTVSADGWLETKYGDGRLVRFNTRDRSRQTIWPDGSVTNSLFSTGQTPSLPPLPATYSGWGAGLEEALLLILGTALSPEQLETYKQSATGRTYYQRVDQHIDSISFLLN